MPGMLGSLSPQHCINRVWWSVPVMLALGDGSKKIRSARSFSTLIIIIMAMTRQPTNYHTVGV